MQSLKTRMELVSEQIFIQHHLRPCKDSWALPIRGAGSAFVPVPSHRGQVLIRPGSLSPQQGA